MARKRKPGTKNKGATTRSLLSRPSSTAPVPGTAGRLEGGDVSGDLHVHNQAKQILTFTTSYVADILRTALWLLKKPLGIVTFAILLIVALGFVIDRFRSVLSPLCTLPVLQFTAVCSSHSPVPLDMKNPKTADFARLVELQDGFSGVMAMNAGVGEIGLKLKQSEMATLDLATLVGVSDFKNREALVRALLQFVDDAQKAGDGLHRLSAKLDGAVDRITIVNDYALHAIQSARSHDEDSASHLALQSVYAPRPLTEDSVLRSFNDAMGVLARETQRSLLEASLNAANLERLQERLITIHEICSREGVALNAAHGELLSELWTVLGGNRQARRKNEMQLALLQAVDQHRKQAHVHVILTREALQIIAADVEELRERAAAPEVVGEYVSPEVMIKFVSQGIERLQEGRQRERGRREALMDEVVNGVSVAASSSLAFSIES